MQGRKKYTKDLYDKLVDGFRKHGDNYAAVAKHAGCDDWRTSKRVWFDGWKDCDWAPPIRLLIENEREEKLAREAAQAEKARKQAEEDAEAARKLAVEIANTEALIQTGARKNVANAFAIISRAVPALAVAINYFNEHFITPDGKPKSFKEIKEAGVDATKALQFMNHYTSILKNATAIGDMVMDRRAADEASKPLPSVAAAPASTIATMSDEDIVKQAKHMSQLLQVIEDSTSKKVGVH